jgi:ribosomal protein L11 methyltransferase
LILALLEKHFQPGFPLIDVGCGSGILSIAALKMGASHALAVDVDRQAIKSTLENAALNGITEDQLETGKGSVEEILTGRFTLQSAPLVMVNILAPIILRLFDDGLADLVEGDGLLLLSGLLDHQEAEVVARAETAGFTIIDRRTDGYWVSLGAKQTHW